MHLGSKSAFTLFEIIIAMAFVGSVTTGLTIGAHDGVPYALAGLGIGLWVAIAGIYFVYWVLHNLKTLGPLTGLALCASLLLAPFLSGGVTSLLEGAKPLPGIALEVLAVVGIVDVFYFSKRQIRRLYTLQRAQAALKRME